MGFELTTLVVIGTDCIGSCKSNYHTITATTVVLVSSISAIFITRTTQNNNKQTNYVCKRWRFGRSLYGCLYCHQEIKRRHGEATQLCLATRPPTTLKINVPRYELLPGTRHSLKARHLFTCLFPLVRASCV